MFIVLSKALKLGAAALCAGALACASALAQTPPTIKLAIIEGFSGPNGNGGEAVFRNFLWATERINARGGVHLPAAAGGSAAGA